MKISVITIIDTLEFNKLAVDVFNAEIAQANLITKTDSDTKLSSLKTITQNKAKHLLVENELNKLKTFDSGLLEKVILEKMVLKII